ncbi:GGDEF domain-containing protein [Chitinilyticum piscinae]|uniref:diguanylate cyclase n=1 Tax=Chitinilyticum piscinae TaxID=2866724 RepID=A0A8J7KAC4_9NEIS|nr:GGDEF domain-containing protein [Chitinilyticum piscinae]MBE9608989.1 GGDEF domain-containing protein [Chitinilyticum piscinae]
MSSTAPVNPVEIARIALKRLTERGLPPTPENYAQFYNAVLTIKAPQDKSNDELQLAWQVIYQLDEVLEGAGNSTGGLLNALHQGSDSMLLSLGSLQNAKRAHAEQRATIEESHTTLEGLLDEVIATTRSMHGTVKSSHSDLQTIRDSLRHIEEDLAFNRKALEQDALTGALNRQGMDHLLSREVKRAQRLGGRLAVAMFDLDEFKQINDRFGHAVGDQVLVHVTSLAKAVLRETDSLIRYGGEEFLIVLVDTDVKGAQYVIDRLRIVAARTPYHHGSQRIEIHFSAGIASLRGDENGRALVLRADEALYRAKHSGRGRVEVAD